MFDLQDKTYSNRTPINKKFRGYMIKKVLILMLKAG